MKIDLYCQSCVDLPKPLYLPFNQQPRPPQAQNELKMEAPASVSTEQETPVSLDWAGKS